MGQRCVGFERSSFLVVKDEKIAATRRKVKTDAHATQVPKAAKALG